MDDPAANLNKHFSIARIRKIEAGRPLDWLRRGWKDLAGNLGASLIYGLLLALVGYLILTYASQRPYLFSVAISGFLLIGPLTAAGLYEISRQAEKGRRIGFFESLQGLPSHRDSLLHFGILLALMLVVWERISAIMFALFYSDRVPDLANFYSDVFFSGDYLQFVTAYLLAGGLLACIVFSISVVSIPMMMERDVDIMTAMVTSARAATSNPAAMLVWGALLVALVLIGFATMMIGSIILLPLLGHATWHAYRDLLEQPHPHE